MLPFKVPAIFVEIGIGREDPAEPGHNGRALALAIHELGEKVGDESGQTGIVTPGKPLGPANDLLVDA
jgi:hypothetical protein